MPTPTEMEKLKINHAQAKIVAQTMIQTMSGMLPAVQIEATAMVMQALFITQLKREARLRHFGEVVGVMRDEIKKSLKQAA